MPSCRLQIVVAVHQIEKRERERGKRGREREIRMLGEPVSERLSLNLECHIFGQFHSFRCLFGSWFYSWTDNEVQDSKATRHSDTRCCAANGRKKINHGMTNTQQGTLPFPLALNHL